LDDGGASSRTSDLINGGGASPTINVTDRFINDARARAGGPISSGSKNSMPCQTPATYLQVKLDRGPFSDGSSPWEPNGLGSGELLFDTSSGRTRVLCASRSTNIRVIKGARAVRAPRLCARA
jgi:hypothetical protein